MDQMVQEKLSQSEAPKVELEFQKLRFRYYENELPNVDDLVVAKVERLTEFAAVVSLEEYDGIEASILFSELQAQRTRSKPSNLIRPGTLEVLQVLRVEPEKKYIDLTRKNLDKEAAKKKMEQFNKSKWVHNMLNKIAIEMHVEDMLLLYRNIVWPIVNSKKWEHPLECFQEAATKPELLDEILPDSVDPHLKKLLTKEICHKLAPHTVKIQSTIQLTCFTMEGINAIMKAFEAAKNRFIEHDLKMNVQGSPLYTVSLTHANEKEARDIVDGALNVIEEEIST